MFSKSTQNTLADAATAAADQFRGTSHSINDATHSLTNPLIRYPPKMF